MAKKKKDVVAETVVAPVKITKKTKAKTAKKKAVVTTEPIIEEAKNIQVNDSTITITLPIEDSKTTPLNHIPTKESLFTGDDIITSEEEANLVEKFKKASENPFELRVKGMKVYDSQTSKLLKIDFADDYIAVGNKKFPYSIVRIINK